MHFLSKKDSATTFFKKRNLDIVIDNFRDRLNRAGITATVRASRGEDILAACGMLAGRHRAEASE